MGKIFLMNKTKEERISFQVESIREEIEEWLSEENWSIYDLEEILESAGLQAPLRFEMTATEKAYKCFNPTTNQERIVVFANTEEDGMKFKTVHEDETGRAESFVYSLNTKKAEDDIPQLQLENHKIVEKPLFIESNYNDFFAWWTLKIGDDRFLEITIDEPDKYETKEEIIIRRNRKEIEDYLLDLGRMPEDFLLADVVKIFNDFLAMLEISNENFLKCEDIRLCYYKKVDKQKRVVSKISFQNTKVVEYAELKDGVTYHVFENGDWQILSDIRDISFNHENKEFSIKITGKEEFMINENLRESIQFYKERIEKIWEFVE